MQQLQIKKEDITEEMISHLLNYLDTGELPEGVSESKIWQTYGRLRARGEKLERAEELLKPLKDKKKESYKWKIINEINQGKHDMRNENIGNFQYEYEIANIKEWAKGRTMQIGFRDIDVNDKLKWRHSILVEERENPEFFQELLDKYKPHEQVLNEDKPF